ncbi:FtsH protease activity modulator HflK [Porticoccaceae bacterium]|jgi:membrane protease subunit HflK|nr:FtsH protease activity modulator HflK [Porticoccaceae bacterium]MCT2534033.1 FtsH protease activity modulator HflK [SAR92 clade bacterium H231]MBT6318561.1 FtsH protease activity modulator HflK [Porticoccaceae bacterium]MDA7815799.1 FtsH protease activity modulator HflK [Porticoccaceae bacterium]MDA8735366.1 FtsH protease activity modulator HflK [Porticoccaceae bacterium]
MAWNEPGGGKDPWGGNRSNEGPPDIDEAIKKLKETFSAFGGGSGSGAGGSGKSLLPIGLLVIAIIWGLLGVYQVDEKEQALVLRLGKYHDTLNAGLKWNPPLIDKVIIVRVTEERQYSARGLMLTQDENIVEISLTVQYNIANARDFVLNIKEPETSLKQATDSALRHVVGSTGLDGVISTGREQVAVGTAQRLQDLLNIYGSGINVVTINIEEARPPTEVKAAYDDVIKAREDLERLVNEAQAYSNGIIPEARGEAQRLREEANGYKSQVVSKSEGEANRFIKLLTEYKKAPQVTRERLYLDAIEEVMTNSSKVLVDTEGGNNMLYLPLDKIIQQGSSGGTLRSSGTSEQMVDRIANEVIEKLQRNSDRVQPERRR